MSTNTSYERALERVVAANSNGARAAANEELVAMAYECDLLAATVSESARQLAARFTAFAAALAADPLNTPASPIGQSTMRALAADEIRLATTRALFWKMLNALHGGDAVKATLAALAA